MSGITKKILATAICGLLLLAGVAATAHEHEGHEGHEGHDETVTLRGEVLDLACYMAHEAKGASHARCAQTCLKGGQPMGLLDSDGKVWLLYANHSDASAYEAAKELAGKAVEVQGKPATRAGMQGLEVGSVKAAPAG